LFTGNALIVMAWAVVFCAPMLSALRAISTG